METAELTGILQARVSELLDDVEKELGRALDSDERSSVIDSFLSDFDDDDEEDDERNIPLIDAGEAQREAFIDASKMMLSDVIRRMVTRIGSQGERAAKDRKKFGLWLNRMDTDTVAEAATPVERALVALGLAGGVADWLGERMRTEFLEMSGRCTAANLAQESAKLIADLGERLPVEASEKFFKE